MLANGEVSVALHLPYSEMDSVPALMQLKGKMITFTFEKA